MIQIMTSNNSGGRATVTPSYVVDSKIAPGGEDSNLGFLYRELYLHNVTGVNYSSGSTTSMAFLASALMGRLPRPFDWGSIILRNSKTKQSLTLLDYYLTGQHNSSIIGYADMEAPVVSDDPFSGTRNAAESTQVDVHSHKRVVKRTFDFIKGHAVGTFDEICVMPCPFLSGTTSIYSRAGVMTYNSVHGGEHCGSLVTSPHMTIYVSGSPQYTRYAVDPQGHMLAIYKGDGVGVDSSSSWHYTYNDGTRFARLRINNFPNTSHNSIVYMDGSFIILGGSHVSSSGGYSSGTAASFYRLGEITYKAEEDVFETTVTEGKFPIPDTLGAAYYPLTGWTANGRHYVLFQTAASISAGKGLVMELQSGLTEMVKSGTWDTSLYNSSSYRDYNPYQVWDNNTQTMYIIRYGYALKVDMDCNMTYLSATKYSFLSNGAFGYSLYPHNEHFWGVQNAAIPTATLSGGYYFLGRVLPLVEPLMVIKLDTPIENTGEDTMSIALTFDMQCLA